MNRETVGAYLTGVYEDELYVAQLQKRELEKQGQLLDAELKSIFTVLAKSQQNTGLEFIGQNILNLERERDNSIKELSRLRRERTVSADLKNSFDDTSLRAALDAAKKAVNECRDRIIQGELEVTDSKKFVEELEIRLRTLDESSTARNYFGKLMFAFCPCCLSEVAPQEKESASCNLCKSTLNSASADVQVLRMRNELRIQLSESVALINEREAELRQLHNAMPDLRRQLKSLENKYTESGINWSSELETAIEGVARKVGGLEQEIKGLYENQRLAETVRQLQTKREAIRDHLNEIDSKIESLIYIQEIRKQKVQEEVASTLGRLLRQDLNRQPEFSRAKNIQFSFTDNIVSVEGATQFSESSTVVLRHLFHLALLSSSTRIPEMRLPRFLILDGIEDGGMELERSYRLQEIIVEECSRFECDYQVIFATSQISPKLENDAYVVARQFSESSRSLAIL